MKKQITLLFFLLMLCGFIACTRKNTSTQNEKIVGQTSEKTQNDFGDTFHMLMSKADTVVVNDDSVSFKDDSGRSEPLTIKKQPKRVAVLYGSHSALWIECGGTVSIGVGGTSAIELYQEQIGRDITQDAGFIKVADSSSGTTWDIEAIIAANPDLIICSTAMKGYQVISSPAVQMNIPVIAVTYSGIKDYLKWAKVFTALNNREDLFAENAMKVAQGVAAIIDAVPENKKVRALSLLPNAKAVKLNMPDSNIGGMLTDLKATNVAERMRTNMQIPRIEMNIEQLYKVNPEIILIQVQQSEDFVKKFLEASFSSNPIWNEVDAVKKNRVYFLPKRLFHFRPNKDYLEAYKMLAELLYPGVTF